MKKYTFILIIAIGIILGFLTGVYLYRINQIDKNLELADGIEDECTEIALVEEGGELIATNNKEEKTSPNSTLTLKIYYNKCRTFN